MWAAHTLISHCCGDWRVCAAAGAARVESGTVSVSGCPPCVRSRAAAVCTHTHVHTVYVCVCEFRLGTSSSLYCLYRRLPSTSFLRQGTHLYMFTPECRDETTRYNISIYRKFVIILARVCVPCARGWGGKQPRSAERTALRTGAHAPRVSCEVEKCSNHVTCCMPTGTPTFRPTCNLSLTRRLRRRVPREVESGATGHQPPASGAGGG